MHPQSWNPHRGTFESNPTWAVGNTPFGPFSNSIILSFALLDSYARNVVLSNVETSLSSLRDILFHFEATGETPVSTLPRDLYFAFDDAWTRLNGRLEQIADPMEKGRRLLEQATEIDPSHEESRIYLAYVLSREGKTLRAAALYRDVFDTAMSLENRGHAAMQLGRLHFAEGAVREALVLWRWMTVSGLAGADHRFNIVRFNIGIAYASLGLDDRALASFRVLMDQHIEAEQPPAQLAQLFVENDDARAIFESRPGFVERLTQEVPELLAGAS